MMGQQPFKEGSKEDKIQLLLWLIFLRVVISTFILLTTFLTQKPSFLIYMSVLVSTSVLVNMLAAFFLYRTDNLRGWTGFLIYWDIAFVTGLVFFSGGFESPFSFMYILSLIYAGLLLSTRGSVFSSVICVISYGGIMFFQWADFLPTFLYDPDSHLIQSVAPREILFKVLINGIAFFIAAFLSNLIAEQLRQTGEQLAEKQYDYEALQALHVDIIRSVEIGLITIGPDNHITFFNPKARKILGLPRQELQNRSFLDLFPDVDRKLFRIDQDSGPGQQRWELPWKRMDDEVLYLGFSLSRLQNTTGSRTGWIVSFQDLTELRRMEHDIKRADRLASVGKLAAGIAHEIRNPLASISGSIQVLASELNLDQINGSLMEIVLRETDRLNRLITDFLDFARPGQVKSEVIDLNLLIDEIVEMIQHTGLEGRKIEFKRDYTTDVFIRADSGQLRQLYLNLLLNAVQSIQGDGQVEIITGIVPDAGERSGTSLIKAEISDNGTGIPQEILDGIFDPFFTTKESGTGLGLTVAYRIVESHHGSISVNSEPDRGTRFTVLMPSEDEADQQVLVEELTSEQVSTR